MFLRRRTNLSPFGLAVGLRHRVPGHLRRNLDPSGTILSRPEIAPPPDQVNGTSLSGRNGDRTFDEDAATAKRDRDESCVDARRNDERGTAEAARLRDATRDRSVRVSGARVDYFVEQHAVSCASVDARA